METSLGGLHSPCRGWERFEYLLSRHWFDFDITSIESLAWGLLS